MLRIEKIFEEEGIDQEIEAYAPLVPDGGNWKATMLVTLVYGITRAGRAAGAFEGDEPLVSDGFTTFSMGDAK